MRDVDWSLLESSPLLLDLPEHGARVVHAGVLPGRRHRRPRSEHADAHPHRRRSRLEEVEREGARHPVGVALPRAAADRLRSQRARRFAAPSVGDGSRHRVRLRRSAHRDGPPRRREDPTRGPRSARSARLGARAARLVRAGLAHGKRRSGPIRSASSTSRLERRTLAGHETARSVVLAGGVPAPSAGDAGVRAGATGATAASDDRSAKAQSAKATKPGQPVESDPEGQAQFDDQQYEESIQTLSAALLRPNNTKQQRVDIYRLLALNYITLNRKDEAESAVRGLLALQPDYTLPARSRRASVTSSAPRRSAGRPRASGHREGDRGAARAGDDAARLAVAGRAGHARSRSA